MEQWGKDLNKEAAITDLEALFPKYYLLREQKKLWTMNGCVKNWSHTIATTMEDRAQILSM
ncbi:MAG: hypothetical protein MSB10_06465 [Clostridiales bacterium]|uniref:hypothetical protein n=1 Tax=Flavonifractor porci TaxID=3133422 RepID=UPI0030A823BD|nr:hypothetical protein [Clostridiales bacterium]